MGCTLGQMWMATKSEIHLPFPTHDIAAAALSFGTSDLVYCASGSLAAIVVTLAV